eukprot:CAMPEP_0197072284 /NCGR_PEP_ID=MMETSP1384-20130603/210019_1 /TAXON_ID=29189 /ORGANISM="Ammonia sp." /LENGTH=434 /DNA_ID=CAMNT_0042511101 /DNA_START=31 /DNA_END=1336 /DNA_ORIENTATION=-
MATKQSVNALTTSVTHTQRPLALMKHDAMVNYKANELIEEQFVIVARHQLSLTKQRAKKSANLSLSTNRAQDSTFYAEHKKNHRCSTSQIRLESTWFSVVCFVILIANTAKAQFVVSTDCGTGTICANWDEAKTYCNSNHCGLAILNASNDAAAKPPALPLEPRFAGLDYLNGTRSARPPESGNGPMAPRSTTDSTRYPPEESLPHKAYHHGRHRNPTLAAVHASNSAAVTRAEENCARRLDTLPTGGIFATQGVSPWAASQPDIGGSTCIELGGSDSSGGELCASTCGWDDAVCSEPGGYALCVECTPSPTTAAPTSSPTDSSDSASGSDSDSESSESGLASAGDVLFRWQGKRETAHAMQMDELEEMRSRSVSDLDQNGSEHEVKEVEVYVSAEIMWTVAACGMMVYCVVAYVCCWRFAMVEPVHTVSSKFP